ncbi:MAG: glycosyltransferase family 39 protein [Candidatus Hodarchaeota archaeon]
MFFGFDISKEDKQNLIILFIVGLVLKLFAFSQIYLISNDGAFQYLPVARLFYEGKYLQALSQPQLPVYPFFISLLTHVTGNPELSGQLISIVFSLLTIIPLYFLASSLFGALPAFWTGVFYLVNPLMLRTSVDVLKEGLVVFCFISSIYFSRRFLSEGRAKWFVWTIVFSLFGALARITVLSVLIALLVWLTFQNLRGRIKDHKIVSQHLWVPLLLIGIVLIFVIPGILGWEVLAGKKYYGVLKDMMANWPHLSDMGQKFVLALRQLIETTCAIPCALAFIGLGFRVKTRDFSTDERYLLFVMIPIVGSFLVRDSARYLLPAIFLLYLWAGFGFVKVRDLIDSKYTRHPRFNAVVVVTVVLLTIVPISLRPQRLHKIGRKEVGLLLQEQCPSPPLILTNIPRVAYYARGSYIRINDKTMPTKRIVQLGKDSKADYIVVEAKRGEVEVINYLASVEQEGIIALLLRYPYGKKGRVIYVYRLN